MAQNVPFVRITVLGPSDSGKTTLINAFVNNSTPSEHQPTLFPELYYRFLRLPSESDPSVEPTPVLIEIEDTVAPDVANDSQPGKHGVQSLETYFDLSRSKVQFPPDMDGPIVPFNIHKPPLTTVFPDKPRYSPLTHTRMCMLFVFDSNDQRSFTEVCRIHSVYLHSLEDQKVFIRPYVCFVANKIDSITDPSQQTMVMNLAEQYTEKYYIRLMRVSALTSKHVYRTFMSLLNLIVQNQILWEVEKSTQVVVD